MHPTAGMRQAAISPTRQLGITRCAFLFLPRSPKFRIKDLVAKPALDRGHWQSFHRTWDTAWYCRCRPDRRMKKKPDAWAGPSGAASTTSSFHHAGIRHVHNGLAPLDIGSVCRRPCPATWSFLPHSGAINPYGHRSFLATRRTLKRSVIFESKRDTFTGHLASVDSDQSDAHRIGFALLFKLF